MDRYQLAKLVHWAEETPARRFESRKRMQKVIFLLKSAGCPIDADYLLHYYGPYSADVAQLTDELVQVGLLCEAPTPNSVGRQFNYTLAKSGDSVLANFESTAEGMRAKEQIAGFEAQAKELLGRGISELEYAATIAYFHKKGFDWDTALSKTCEFKRLVPESQAVKAAFELAKSVVR